MNWDRIESNWQQLKSNIQQQWNKLTDDDLDAMDGKREGLSGKIQETYGINKVEADHQLDNWQSTQNDPVNLYNTDIKGDLDNEMNSLSNTTYTNNFGYDDIADENVGHNIAGKAPRSMQDGMGDNESIESDAADSNADNWNSGSPISVSQNSGSSSSVIQGSGSSNPNPSSSPSSNSSPSTSTSSSNLGLGSYGLGNQGPNNPGPGDGAGIPGSDESDDDMDDSGIPTPNPMPDDFDEPVRAKNHETPHEEKSLDQT